VSVILDASATLAWVFGEEVSPAVLKVFEEVAERGAVVPALWWLEVANSLAMALRRKGIDEAFRNAALSDLAVLDITTDQQTAAQAWSDTLALADRHRLSVYAQHLVDDLDSVGVSQRRQFAGFAPNGVKSYCAPLNRRIVVRFERIVQHAMHRTIRPRFELSCYKRLVKPP
jgi:predicted nucleic acid-binding protein